jgi:vancomycin resistance protein YoaR
LAIIIAAVVVICAMGAVKLIGSYSVKEADAETHTEPDTELQKEVKVEGVTITGMSKEDAGKAIHKKYKWGMKVTYKDQEYELTDLLDDKIEKLLNEIYQGGEPKESYTIDMSGLEDKVKTEVDAIAAKWDVPAKNGQVSEFNKKTGKFIYSGEQTGFAVDKESLTKDIMAQMKDKNFEATIAASGTEVAPEMTEAQAQKAYKVIGTFTTTTTANSDRNKNIELASKVIDGMILQPGEEFSFNNSTGERTQAKGYRMAGAYRDGLVIKEPGGGVCQVSSTLYNAVIFAGLTPTERHAHSYEPHYVTPGEDATVSYGGPDMKFVNNSSSAIAIRTNFANRKLKVSIVGIPILEEGVTLSLKSKKAADLDAPAPIYEEDQTLQPEEEKVVKAEQKGSSWVTNLVTKKDGKVVKEELLHRSIYRGKSATIKRNTSGVVIQPTTSPDAISETTKADETDSSSVDETTTAPIEIGPGMTQPTAAQTTQADSAQGPAEATTKANTDNNSQDIVPPNPMGN